DGSPRARALRSVSGATSRARIRPPRRTRSAESAPRRREARGGGSCPDPRGPGTRRDLVFQLGRSIGKRSVGTACRAAAEDEVLEVRERLGDGEAPLRRREVVAEETQRDVVAAPRLGAQRGPGLVEPPLVVPDQ